MRWRVRLLSITLLGWALSCGTVVHSAMTGADFLQAPQSYQNGFVNGFVRGMYLTCLDHLETKKEICSFAPQLDATFEMTPDQVLEIFLNYLKKSGDLQQKEASESFVDCLKETARKSAKPE
jgi:hypothetical protein